MAATTTSAATAATGVAEEHNAAPNGTPVEARWPTIDFCEDMARTAKHAVEEARHTAAELTAKTEDTVRRHPLATVGAAIAVGAAFGCLFGLGLGWAARSRR